MCSWAASTIPLGEVSDALFRPGENAEQLSSLGGVIARSCDLKL